MAFLLLETRSLVSFSLLFGTTWLVNALAFFAILASRPAGDLRQLPGCRSAGRSCCTRRSSGRWRSRPCCRRSRCCIDPPALRYVLAAALAFAPVFFANLVFSHSFRDTRTADMAFASNLLGALAGGALEYLALLAGYQSLLLVVAGLYVMAYLLATRVRLLADVDLVSERTGPAQPVAATGT